MPSLKESMVLTFPSLVEIMDANESREERARKLLEFIAKWSENYSNELEQWLLEKDHAVAVDVLKYLRGEMK